MIAELKSSPANPCAWLWHCPACKARVVLMNTGQGLAFQSHPCCHAIAPVMDGGQVSVKFAESE